MAPNGKQVAASVCALDCPDCCSVLVHIEDGRGVKLQGNPDHPVTRGFLCGKVAQYLERVYHPDRLLHPLRRTGAKGEARFERIPWDEALDTVAARLLKVAREHGPEAVLPYSYAGTMGYLNGAGMDRRFFHRLGASRLDRTICSSAGGAGLMESLGARVGTEPEQIPLAKYIIAWGANIHGTNIHYWPFIVEARRRGAKLVVIDPIQTRTAGLADWHLRPYPGSDLALALGLIHVILRERLEDSGYIAQYTQGIDSLRARAAAYPPERVEALTGIASGDVVRLAREYASTSPAFIRLNYGVQRSERGGKAVRAIALLPALTGAWRHAGGGLTLTTSGAFAMNFAGLQRPDLGPPARTVNMSRLGEVLTELDSPPVQALVVYNSNPAAIAPHQAKVRRGLLRGDLFTVVLEQFLTDTARHADIVLPVTTFLEHTDLYFAYGHYHLQMSRPALEAPGECRTNVEIFRALAQRCGFNDPCFAETEDDMIRTALASGHPHLEGITLEELDARRSVRLKVAPAEEPYLPFAHGNFGTPSGRCDLSAETLDYVPPIESRHGDESLRAHFPLELVSSKNDDSMNSTFGHRSEVDAQTLLVHLHDDDAATRGIAPGDRVRVWNQRGALELEARVGTHVRPGVVRIPAVGWGANPNLLISDRLTDIGGGPAFYNCLVEVEKCGSSLS